uniref:hypothetical protein n=1 Tax=unclassified Streptomyces TaxID=2593676 RepID=UPI0008049A4B
MTMTPADDAASILGPITPIRCPLTGCHWSCHGVPDKYADSRARIVREHLAAEHTPTPEPADRPADQLRAAVARALVRYDWNAGLSGRDTPSEHHYGEADAALAVLPAPALVVARQLLGTTSEAKRNEIRQSYSELAAQAREDRDHEGAADVELKLRDREEQWRREDAAAVETVEEREPIQLRWGLDDVMYGDDDTTTVVLSGPGGEPYWVELDPERTAALRNALAGPESTAQPAPV